jgi:hypothetical protein
VLLQQREDYTHEYADDQAEAHDGKPDSLHRRAVPAIPRVALAETI